MTNMVNFNDRTEMELDILAIFKINIGAGDTIGSGIV